MSLSKHPSWHALITDCFASTTFMALATQGPKGVWVNPVYFAWDKADALYFISELDCLHMHNLQASPQIACTIYPTDHGADVFGSYLTGQAEILTQPDDKKAADDVYYGRVYPDDQKGAAREKDSYRLNPAWHFVKIVIDELWYFDTRYFGEKRVSVPRETFKLRLS